jgi:hypothetical protein
MSEERLGRELAPGDALPVAPWSLVLLRRIRPDGERPSRRPACGRGQNRLEPFMKEAEVAVNCLAG